MSRESQQNPAGRLYGSWRNSSRDLLDSIGSFAYISSSAKYHKMLDLLVPLNYHLWPMNLHQPTPELPLHDLVGVEFYCPHALDDSNYHIHTKEKNQELSSIVLCALSPYSTLDLKITFSNHKTDMSFMQNKLLVINTGQTPIQMWHGMATYLSTAATSYQVQGLAEYPRTDNASAGRLPYSSAFVHSEIAGQQPSVSPSASMHPAQNHHHNLLNLLSVSIISQVGQRLQPGKIIRLMNHQNYESIRCYNKCLLDTMM